MLNYKGNEADIMIKGKLFKNFAYSPYLGKLVNIWTDLLSQYASYL